MSEIEGEVDTPASLDSLETSVELTPPPEGERPGNPNQEQSEVQVESDSTQTDTEDPMDNTINEMERTATGTPPPPSPRPRASSRRGGQSLNTALRYVVEKEVENTPYKFIMTRTSGRKYRPENSPLGAAEIMRFNMIFVQDDRSETTDKWSETNNLEYKLPRGVYADSADPPDRLGVRVSQLTPQ